MTRRLRRISLFLAAASCSAALSGCAGRSAGPEGVTPIDYPSGLTASDAAAVHATDADDHALAALLPNPANRFAPVSSALGAVRGGPAVGLASDASVRSVSSDGGNGFRVTHVLDGEEREVHFRASDFATPHHPDGYYRETEAAIVRLSSPFGSFGGQDRNRGHPDLRYFDVNRLDVIDHALGEHRIFAVYGARTTADALPAGKALYLGAMIAQTVDTDGLSEADDLFGLVTLTADFAESTLEGAIAGLLTREHDSLFPAPHSPGSHFRIEDGEIVGGRFTASLIGADSSVGAPLGETVGSYEGAMLGEFYGPGAEELGGVVNARSEAHDRVLAGSFGGTFVTDDLEPPAGDASVQSIAIERDHVAGSARRADARVTTVESDAAGGTFVTYMIDGVEQRVHFTPSDLDADSAGYVTRIGNRAFRTEPVGGLYLDEAAFDYFDVGAWAATDHAGDGTVLIERIGYGVVGVPTPFRALPRGRASYHGRVYAQSEPEDAGESGSTRTYEGRLELTAHFGTGAIEGMIDGLRNTAGAEPDPDDLARRVFVRNGEIIQGEFTAELNDDLQDAAGFIGEMRGQFYGPAAAEVGGVLEGRNHLSDHVVHGWFGGTRTVED